MPTPAQPCSNKIPASAHLGSHARTDRPTARQTGRQTDRQTDRHIDRQADRQRQNAGSTGPCVVHAGDFETARHYAGSYYVSNCSNKKGLRGWGSSLLPFLRQLSFLLICFNSSLGNTKLTPGAYLTCPAQMQTMLVCKQKTCLHPQLSEVSYQESVPRSSAMLAGGDRTWSLPQSNCSSRLSGKKS